MSGSIAELGLETRFPRIRRPVASRRRALVALAVSSALHAALLAWITLSRYAPPIAVRDATPLTAIEVDLLAGPFLAADPTATEPAAPPAEASAAPAPGFSLVTPLAVPLAGATAGAPEPAASGPAIPSSTLRAMRAAPLPLIGSPTGIRRREAVLDPRRIARARAESLLATRLADLPGSKRRDPGAIGIADGGVRVAVPWGGFTRSDRSDGAWRKKRCGGGERDGDKPGEKEARSRQC